MSCYSFNIDYKSLVCELCYIGSKYDTDKSSLRKNVTNERHCHPYTLFYNALFRNQKNNNLNIAEIGILNGSSLLMWREYFSNSKIYGFEYNNDLINSFRKKYNNNNIILSNINVKDKNNIKNAFNNLNKKYDIIIDDSTHEFEDQINVIQNTYEYLNDGGILIIEDIFKKYNEKDYIDRLADVLCNFQEYYFVSLDHNNKNSFGWNNDKLFILVKNGTKIFNNTKKMTVITPSYRLDNLLKIKENMNFDYIDEWIIVYDGSKINKIPNLFLNETKIKEYICNDKGISGNPQRNFALNKITNEDTYLYYLDDDNLIHPDLYKLLNIVGNQKICTFNQKNRINGDKIEIGSIDTAMVLIDFKLCKNIRWIIDKYEADFFYIKSCYLKNKFNWIYVNNELCYYNNIN